MFRAKVRVVGLAQGEGLPKNSGDGREPLTVLHKTYFRIKTQSLAKVQKL